MAETTVYIIDLDDKVRAKLKAVQAEAKKTDSSFGGLAGTIKGLAGGAAVGALVAIGKGIYDITAQAEQTRVSMEVMLGDAGKANKMINEIRAFAAATPFETQELQDAAQMMLGYGIAAEKIMPNIKMLGDVAMGNSDKFNRLTYAFSQIQATGRLMGQDLMQLINAGFNPLKTISDKTGISMAKLKKQMSGGMISADMVEAAFRIETSAGGRFFGMMDKQAQTLAGKMSTIIDNVKLLGLSMGQSAQGGMHMFLDKMLSIVNTAGTMSWEPLIDGLTGVGNTFEAIFEPINKIFSLFGGTGMFTMSSFMKNLSTTMILLLAPIRIIADAVDKIYESLAGILTLDWDRIKKVGNFDTLNNIKGDLTRVWTDEQVKKGTGEKDPGLVKMFGGNLTKDPYMFGQNYRPEVDGNAFDELGNGEVKKKGKKKKLSAGGIELNESRNGATNITINIDTFQKNEFKDPSPNSITQEVSNVLNSLAIGLSNVLNDSQIVGAR